jgi:AcrR family transcriptional regulator
LLQNKFVRASISGLRSRLHGVSKAASNQGDGMAEAKRNRRTQAERSEAAEANLLEAALHLIGEHGATGMTLGQVGVKAGYSRGLPTHHFGSKARLLRALAEEARQRGRLDAYHDGPAEGLAFILSFAGRYVHLPRPMEMRAMHVMQAEAIMAESELSEPMREFNRGTIDELAGHIARAIELGEIPGHIEPRRSAILLLGMLRGVTLLLMIDPGGLGARAATLDVASDVKALFGVRG